jgi:hypothetical protein
MPLIFHHRFIRRYTDALVPPVITVRRHDYPLVYSALPPFTVRRLRLRLRRHSRVRARAAPLRRSFAAHPRSPTVARVAPPCQSRARAAFDPRVWVTAPPIPAWRHRGSTPAVLKGCARANPLSTADPRRRFLAVVSKLPIPLLLCTVSAH